MRPTCPRGVRQTRTTPEWRKDARTDGRPTPQCGSFLLVSAEGPEEAENKQENGTARCREAAVYVGSKNRKKEKKEKKADMGTVVRRMRMRAGGGGWQEGSMQIAQHPNGIFLEG